MKKYIALVIGIASAQSTLAMERPYRNCSLSKLNELYIKAVQKDRCNPDIDIIEREYRYKINFSAQKKRQEKEAAALHNKTAPQENMALNDPVSNPINNNNSHSSMEFLDALLQELRTVNEESDSAPQEPDTTPRLVPQELSGNLDNTTHIHTPENDTLPHITSLDNSAKPTASFFSLKNAAIVVGISIAALVGFKAYRNLRFKGPKSADPALAKLIQMAKKKNTHLVYLIDSLKMLDEMQKNAVRMMLIAKDFDGIAKYLTSIAKSRMA